MNSMFNPSKIRVIVWDVDGTWYRHSGRLLGEEVKQRCLVVAEILKISFEKAKGLEEKTVLETKSHTKAVSKLTGLSIMEVLNRVQAKIDRGRFLGKDQKLIEMFEGLKDYRHSIVSNMKRDTLFRTMELLGVDRKIFDFIVLPEDSGVTKPDPAPFKMVLEKTGLTPSNHLFVGDREQVDIIPAKKLGMQTCFVWGKSEVADISIETVYDLSDIMLL